MKVTYNLVVDFARPNKSNSIIISEGDANSRLLHFTLLADKQPMDMLGVTIATVRGVKSDGSTIFGDATIVTDPTTGSLLNEIEYTLPEAFADVAGRTTMTITLSGNDGSAITSFEWYIEVRNQLYNEDDYISEEDLQGYRDLLNRSMAALEKMEAMVQKDALPCPYPINITIEEDEFVYNGAAQIDIELKDIAHIAEATDIEVEALDESAAKSASESAIAATAAADSADESYIKADYAAHRAELARDEAKEYQQTAINNAGLAEGYATQCRNLVDSSSETIRNIQSNIDTLWRAVFPTES